MFTHETCISMENIFTVGSKNRPASVTTIVQKWVSKLSATNLILGLFVWAKDLPFYGSGFDSNETSNLAFIISKNNNG